MFDLFAIEVIFKLFESLLEFLMVFDIGPIFTLFNNLKKDYIDNGLVRFEHHAFPLDLAALNAEVIIRCQANNEKKFALLEEIYNKQKSWAVGSDINKRKERVLKRGVSKEYFNLMNKKQFNENIKSHLSDFTIQNNGSILNLRLNIIKLLNLWER